MKSISFAATSSQLMRKGATFVAATVAVVGSACLPCNQQSDCTNAGDVCAANGFCTSAVGVDVEIIPAVGRFSEFQTCDVIATPPGTDLPSEYDQYLNCSGIPIVAMGDVSQEALLLADDTIEFLVRERPSFRDAMITSGDFHILRGPGVTIADLPTAFPLANDTVTASADFNSSASTSVAQFLFCDESEPGFYGSNQFVEIMAIHLFGVATRPTFGLGAEVDGAFRAAINEGLWSNTFAGTGVLAYVTELSAKWFEVGRPAGPVNGDGVANGIITREQLREYDPDGAAVMNSMWTDSFDVPGCVRRNQVVIND